MLSNLVAHYVVFALFCLLLRVYMHAKISVLESIQKTRWSEMKGLYC